MKRLSREKLYRDVFVTYTNHEITPIAVGPLTQQPMCLPLREVLILQVDGSYVVHTEIFYEMPSDNGVVCTPQYSDGEYFKAHELAKAVKRFGERLAHKSLHLESLVLDAPY